MSEQTNTIYGERALKGDIVRYCQDPELVKAVENEHPLASWSNFIELRWTSSKIYVLAACIFSVCCHAADLEQVWSQVLLCLPPHRIGLKFYTLQKMMSAKIGILTDEPKER